MLQYGKKFNLKGENQTKTHLKLFESYSVMMLLGKRRVQAVRFLGRRRVKAVRLLGKRRVIWQKELHKQDYLAGGELMQ